MPTVTELTELRMHSERRKWGVAAFGSYFLGSALDRPMRITAGKLMYCGIKDPLYGLGWGPNYTGVTPWSFDTRAVLTATAQAINTQAMVRVSAVSGGVVTAVELVIKGFGYGGVPATSTTAVTGSGTGLTINATLTATRVTGVSIGSGGTGYAVDDRIALAAPAAGESAQVPEYGPEFYLAAPAAGAMSGEVTVVEVWYRELTKERSLAGAATAAFDATNNQLHIASNAVAPATELYISHREFYVNFTDAVGVYHLAARIPYVYDEDTYSPFAPPVGGEPAEENMVNYTTVNVSAETISRANRKLESQRQTALFPAVRTATFVMERIVGGMTEPRVLEAAATIAFVEGSDTCTIANDTFLESDVLKGIVDLDNNQIVAFIDRVLTSTTARILLPNNTGTSNAWRLPNTTYSNVQLSGDEGMLYFSPIYAGEAAGGITVGILTHNALDELKDQALYAAGAKIGKVCRVKEDLVVVYDRGLAVYEGEVSVSAPPQLRYFLAAEGSGTFNPDSAWTTPAGDLWIQGSDGRTWRYVAGQLEDVSLKMGTAGNWRRRIEPDMYAQNLFQVSYNPDINAALMVNVPKQGDESEQLGTYAIALCHDTNSVNPQRWPAPVSMRAITCCRHDDGQWVFYGGAGSWIYKVLDPSKVKDTYIDGETEMANQTVTGYLITGTDYYQGTVATKSIRFVIESTAETGIQATVSFDMKGGNIVSPTFTASQTPKEFSHTELSRLPWLNLNRDTGVGVQYKFEFESPEAEMTLIEVHALHEVTPPRGMRDGA